MKYNSSLQSRSGSDHFCTVLRPQGVVGRVVFLQQFLFCFVLLFIVVCACVFTICRMCVQSEQKQVLF